MGRRALLLASLAAAAALPSASQAAAAAGTPPARAVLALHGAGIRRLDLCGHRRSATLAVEGRRILAVATLRRRAHGGRSGGSASATVVMDRCRHGRWIAALRQRVTARHGRWTVALAATQPGDYRLRALIAVRGSRLPRQSEAVYLRVRPRPVPSQPSPTPPAPPPPAPQVVDVPVSFTVRNVNNSAVSCSTDGAEYRLSGRLVAPRAALESPAKSRAATLYLHEFSYGQFLWRFPIATYDYAAAQARAGHVSIVIDRLGYGASPHPAGTQTCFGAHADMAHQIVGQLRAGSYGSPALGPVAFGRVALAGLGVGGGIAELEAYSFHDVDSLVLFGWASQGYSPHAIQDGVQQGGACAGGGEPSQPGGETGYAYFSTSADDFKTTDFYDAEPAVLDAAVAMRSRDPCGDVNSQVPMIASSGAHSREISVPVLLVYGLQDTVNQQPSTGQQQSQMYGASNDVTTIFIDRAGHALPLERSAPRTRAEVAGWLKGHGL